MFDFGLENGSDTRFIRQSLMKFGIRLAHRSFNFKAQSALNMGLKFDALIGTRTRRDEWFHWMVWDAEAQRLLDPLKSPYSRPPVEWYLRIIGR